jgi:DNA (cytosine-5)-methyltransferase 1
MAIIFSHTQGLDPQPSEIASPTLRRNGNGMAILMRMREGKPGGGKGPLLSEDKSLTIATANDQTLFHKSDVRRLTPVECERLQGFPDDWTAGQSDSARYKQMGNAVAVPVVEWIIQGIVDTLI